MSRSLRSALAGCGAVLVLMLSGCIRFQANLSINPDDTVDGSVVIATVLGDGDGDDDKAKDDALTLVEAIEEQVLPAAAGELGATRSEYDEDGYYGIRYRFENTPLAAFDSNALSITRDGDEFVFSGVLDLTPDDGQIESDPDAEPEVTVAVTFPGAVTQHNGELSGRTVTWQATPSARVEMDARGGATAIGLPIWGSIVAAAGGVAIIVAVLLVVLRRRGSVLPSEPPRPPDLPPAAPTS